MGYSISATFRFAMQLNFKAFVKQISIANFSKLADLFNHDCIVMHTTAPKKLHDAAPYIEVYSVTTKENTKTKEEKVKDLKKLLEDLGEKNDILIFRPEPYEEMFESSCCGEGDFHETKTVEDLDSRRSLFRDFAEDLGLKKYKVVANLTSTYS